MKVFLSAILLVSLAVFGVPSLGLTAPITYTANLDGPSEFPPVASFGTGFATVIIDVTVHTLDVDVTFSGLTGTTTAAHIHAPTPVPFTNVAGVATQTPSFVGFPLGVTSGTYHQIFDTTLASTWNASYITANGGTPLGAEAALAEALSDGRAYFNIHSSFAPGGEIRGFLTPVPASMLLLGTGLAGLAGMRFKKNKD